jgi:hypothetical protein
MDPRIPVQVLASLAKRIKTFTSTIGSMVLYVEGVDTPTEEDFQRDNLSLRVDGPTVIESSSWTTYRVSVQVLVTAVGDRTAYGIHQTAGKVAEVLREVIPVYDIPGNPLVQVGCLDIDPRTPESVRLVNLGRVSQSSNVKQISVIANLILDIN